MEIKTSKGVIGWFYKFRCQFEKVYELFWFDGACYQVKRLVPRLENYWKSPPTGNLYSSGKICLGDVFHSGIPSFEEGMYKISCVGYWNVCSTQDRSFLLQLHQNIEYTVTSRAFQVISRS